MNTLRDNYNYPNGKRRVILIKTNLLDRDPWLAKEIDTLKRGGYSITLLCWDRDCKSLQSEPREETEDFTEIRLKFKAPYGIKILPFLPIWWFFEFLWLMRAEWNIVHAINFDSIFPALIAGKLKKQMIVYEIYDVYADLILLPHWLRKILINLEKFFMRHANAMIIANEAQVKELNGIPNNNIIEIYNTPPDYFKKLCEQRNEKGQKKDVFTIFYAGVLYRSRPMNLEKVFMAIKNIDDVKLIVAGYGDHVTDIEKWVKESKGKAEFISKINYTEVLKRTMVCDLLFALYDPIILSVRHATCNKLFEAMMCQKPILVSKGTAMADMVYKENCGLVVDCNSIDEIKKAIIRLKDNPGLCRQIGENGRRAYELKYNREIMEHRLLTFYHDISLTKHERMLTNGS